MSIVFVSHPFSNDPIGNKDKVELICKDLVEEDILPLSPLHMFSFMENDDQRDSIMEICKYMINIATEVWVYGESPGCKEEMDYAKKLNKPIRLMY